MKSSWGLRLFIGLFSMSLAVGVVSLALFRWTALDVFTHPSDSSADAAVVEALGAALGASHATTGDWSGAGKLLDAEPRLRNRLGVLDAQRELVAGVKASRWLVALTSIDSVERPIVVDGRRLGAVVLARAANADDDVAVAFLVQRQQRFGWVLMLMLGCVLVATAVFAAGVRRPIAQLVEGARQLEAGRFSVRLQQTRTDELGQLARAFNQLASRLERTENDRRDWIAQTSHELRTPLAVLRRQLGALRDGLRPLTTGQLEVMSRHVAALTRIVEDLSVLARADLGTLELRREPLDVWALVRQAIEDVPLEGLTVQLGAPPVEPTIHADAGRLRQVFVNLLQNTARYASSGGRLEVSATQQGEWVLLHFDDSAPGVPADALPRLGERFFRVENSRARSLGGAGLGLAVSRQWVEAHGGRLEFAASPLGGLRVTVRLRA